MRAVERGALRKKSSTTKKTMRGPSKATREKANRLLKWLAPFDQWIKTTGAVEASRHFGDARKFYEQFERELRSLAGE